MKLFNIKYNINFCEILVVVFFAFIFSFPVHGQQISTTPLFIEEVVEYQGYSAYVSGNTPGLCLLATFYTETQTNIKLRTAPFSSIDNPTWLYNSFTPDIDPLEDGVSMSIGSGLQPATEYIAQFVEIGADGSYHIITPENPTDDIQIICTPNSDGTLNPSCPSNTVLVSDCSSAGVNQALQSGGSDNLPGTASIENITPDEDSVSFVVDTSNLESGVTYSIVYSSSVEAVGQNFTGPTQSALFTTNGGNVSVEIPGLLNNTTYYLTIFSTNGSIIINTTSNLPYESFTTGVQNNNSGSGTNNGISGLGMAGTINVNIDGTFSSEELDGENIEQGFTQCGYGDMYDCDFNQLLATIDRIIKFMLYVIVLPLAAILFAWAGIKLIIAKSQGKQAALSEAKSLFGQVLLGIVFAMGAWVIVKFILIILGYTDTSGILNQILGITTQ